jgi:ornithine cyclodeaminase
MIVLDESAILARHDPRRLIEAVAEAFLGGLTAPPRGHHALGETDADGTLLVMPAWRAGGDVGVKIVTVLPRNAARGRPTVDGVYVLLNDDGSLRALIEARTLTLIRTAAVSALAASRLASPQAETLLMVGAGALAPHLVRAHRAVRDYRRVRLWARRPEQAAALAKMLGDEGVPAEIATDLDAAQAEADVISCATLAREPLIHGRRLKAGAHLDLVGGYTPQMREADDEAIRRARVVVDSLKALDEAGDLAIPVASGVLDPERVTDLPSLLAGRAPPPGEAEITLFKSVGTATADFAAAEALMNTGA